MGPHISEAALARASPVGDILGWQRDCRDRTAAAPIYERAILISGSMHRVEVTLGALCGHVADVSNTDETAARDILQADAHEQAHPEDPW